MIYTVVVVFDHFLTTGFTARDRSLSLDEEVKLGFQTFLNTIVTGTHLPNALQHLGFSVHYLVPNLPFRHAEDFAKFQGRV